MSSSSAAAAVSFHDYGDHVVLGNGILEVTITKPGGDVVGIKYGGIDNLLTAESHGGYWDLNWSLPNQRDTLQRLSGSKFHVITQNSNIIELSFYQPYNSSSTMVPLNLDKRPAGWPGFNLNQTRVVFKLREDHFDYMAISDAKQRVMPYPEDRASGKQLAYPEAVLLTNPKNPDLKGEVDDKYQYSCDNSENKLHGWISFKPLVGFWIITPSNEFRNGGPTKQELQSHVGPTCLSMFHSAHYGGRPLCATFQNGEAWKKAFGPVFIYLNSSSTDKGHSYLWQDAKQQLNAEVEAWPYIWPASPDFAIRSQRGSVSGRLYVKDSYVSSNPYPASLAYVGLARPGDPGSWQTESKGYQFWAQTDTHGYFKISNVVPGTYDLYGWVPGVIGDYKKQDNSIIINEGSSLELGNVIYYPPRSGPTLWEIGIPDRTAIGYIPQSDPKFVNKLFIKHERFRQYGLWTRYSEIYTQKDLIFTIESSNWKKDWFFIHGCRIRSDGALEAPTWEIKFDLKQVMGSKVYWLHISLASSATASLQVSVNTTQVFKKNLPGRDNAIARHGLHGIYSVWSVEVQGGALRKGTNSIFLTQTNITSIFNGVMYDYLRLEAPSM